mgnify:CR=1 FL=1
MKAFSITLAVTTSEEGMHGLGEHIYDLSAEDVTIALKVSTTHIRKLNFTRTEVLDLIASAC